MFFCLHNPGARYSLSWPANYPIWWVLREESTKIRTETRKYTPRLSAMKTFGFHKQTPNIFMVQIIFSVVKTKCTFAPLVLILVIIKVSKSCTTRDENQFDSKFALIFGSHLKPQLGCFVSDFLAIGHTLRRASAQKVKLFQKGKWWMQIPIKIEQHLAEAEGATNWFWKGANGCWEIVKTLKSYSGGGKHHLLRPERATSWCWVLNFHCLILWGKRQHTQNTSATPVAYHTHHLQPSILIEFFPNVCSPPQRPPQRVEIEFRKWYSVALWIVLNLNRLKM